ncbi:hypothetical protein BGZ46_006946, partial [Entomortierella lignicola]
MSETVPQTLDEIKEHINRYQVLADHIDDDPDYDQVETLTTREDKAAAAKSMKLPKAYTITAPKVNEVSHSRRIGKKRERRLKMKANKDARQALEEISKRDAILKTSKTMAEIDAANSLRR